MLYRVFPWIPGNRPAEDGGPLFVPRAYQRRGRHDNPEAYGALYATRSRRSAIAERLSLLRDREITAEHLSRIDGRPYAMASIDDSGLELRIDLDDPGEFSARELRPSHVATRERSATRDIAMAIFDEGHAGFAWWSTIEASWSNVTLFAERAAAKLSIAGEPEPLRIDDPMLRGVAELIGVWIAGAG